jgi:hypothetical protein
MNFTQTDLIPEDVMMLDAYNNIFLWIGTNSNKTERDKAVTMAMEYLKTGDYTIHKHYEHRVFISSYFS